MSTLLSRGRTPNENCNLGPIHAINPHGEFSQWNDGLGNTKGGPGWGIIVGGIGHEQIYEDIWATCPFKTYKTSICESGVITMTYMLSHQILINVKAMRRALHATPN